MSTTLSPFVTATAITEISSAALRPTIEPPSTTPVAGSEMIFTKPRGVALDERLRVRGERHLRHPDLPTGRESLRLGQPDVGDLGLGEDRRGGLLVVEVAVSPRVHSHQVLGDLASLHRRDGGQRELAREVAGRVDVGDVRQAVVVHHDVAGCVDVDPHLVEPEIFGVRDRADRQHHVRRIDAAAVVTRDEHPLVGAGRRLRPRALQELDPARQELVLEHRRDLRVLQRENLLAGDDERHLRPERAEHVRELDAGDARPDDAQVLRDLGRRVGLASGEDALTVDHGPVRDARAGAGREHDEVGRRDARSPSRWWRARRAGRPACRCRAAIARLGTRAACTPTG